VTSPAFDSAAPVDATRVAEAAGPDALPDEAPAHDGFLAAAPAPVSFLGAEPSPVWSEAERSPVASRADEAAFVWFAVLPFALAFAADEPVAPAGLAAFPDAHYLDVRSGSAAAAPESGPDG
jgi:hypothetical protein